MAFHASKSWGLALTTTTLPSMEWDPMNGIYMKKKKKKVCEKKLRYLGQLYK